MKALMIFGSIVGFVTGGAFGLAASSSGPTTWWRACAAALIAALLTRWWGRVWLAGLRDALEQRHRPRTNPPAKPTGKA